MCRACVARRKTRWITIRARHPRVHLRFIAVEFYVTKNQVSLESGEACTEKIPATIIGAVSEKDGRQWITASKITKAK